MLSSFTGSTGNAIEDLVFTLVALLRADGHLCNVLTHISSGDWRAVEQAITSILSSRTSSKKLPNVARNMLELICDNRGVTGRIMRPFFFEAIARIAGKSEMTRLEKKVRRLRHRISSDAQIRVVHSPRTGKSNGARSTQKIQVHPRAPVPQDANGVTL